MIATLFAQAGNIAPVEEKIGLFQMMQRGGPLMVVLFVCSVVALFVFIERLFYYKRSRMNVSEFLAGVLALVRRQSYAEAITRCEEGHGPIVSSSPSIAMTEGSRGFSRISREKRRPSTSRIMP